MLEINDFVAERGGDIEKIRESQRRRHAPVDTADEVFAMYEDHRKSESKKAVKTFGTQQRLNK